MAPDLAMNIETRSTLTRLRNVLLSEVDAVTEEDWRELLVELRRSDWAAPGEEVAGQYTATLGKELRRLWSTRIRVLKPLVADLMDHSLDRAGVRNRDQKAAAKVELSWDLVQYLMQIEYAGVVEPGLATRLGDVYLVGKVPVGIDAQGGVVAR